MSELKAYARRTYGIRHNISVLTMLITEEEHQIFTKVFNEWEKRALETKTLTDLAADIELKHKAESFFQYPAVCLQLIHTYKTTQRNMYTTIIKNMWTDIPHFERYNWAIMIREEQLSAYSHKLNIAPTSSSTGQLNDDILRMIGLSRLLTHEFLHILEHDSKLKIYSGDIEQDAIMVTKVMSQIRINKVGNY